MYEIKTEDVFRDFSSDKESFNFSTYSKYYDSSKLVNGKVNDETGGIAIEKFVGLKPKMYSFLVRNNKYKNAKGANINVVALIIHYEHKYVLFNSKCLRHVMDRIQCKDHRIGIYEFNKMFAMFWWQNKYSKQWIRQISFWVLEIINDNNNKNSYLNNYFKKIYC